MFKSIYHTYRMINYQIVQYKKRLKKQFFVCYIFSRNVLPEIISTFKCQRYKLAIHALQTRSTKSILKCHNLHRNYINMYVMENHYKRH